MIRTIAFRAAVVGYVLLAIMIVAGGAGWPGYSHSTQFISELGATGAPHGRLVSLGGFLPIGICVTLFAVLAAMIEPRSLLRTLGFLCLVVFASGYTAAAFFPCDFGCRPATPSFSQMMHNLFGLGGYVLGPIGLILLGIAARKWPGGQWLAPLGLICGLVAGAAFFGIGSDVAGLAQRVLEAAVALWILACAFSLRRVSGASSG